MRHESPLTRRSILALVPRVNAHPTHAVVDGVTYPGGLAEYRAKHPIPREVDAGDVVRCCNCGWEGTVPRGSDDCPACRTDHALSWPDTSPFLDPSTFNGA